MKSTLHYILLSFGLAIITPAGIERTYSQDAGLPYFDMNDGDIERDRERIISSPGETDPILNAKSHSTTSSTSAKDTIPSAIRLPVQKNIKPVESSKNANKSKSEDDSILSFNFLYYIIQKYKLQDIVD